MYILSEEPKGGELLDAYTALDEAFGTEEFSEGQGITVISLGLEVESSRANELLHNLVSRGCVQEN